MSGHAITHTVFVECHQMYRQDGPPELRPLGETEFVNGIAAMSASGAYGPCHVAHRIVGSADLLLGADVECVLQAHLAAAGERFRGIRFDTAYSEAGLFGFPANPATRHVMLDARFREGAGVLAAMGLSLDVWCLHGQLGAGKYPTMARATISLIQDAAVRRKASSSPPRVCHLYQLHAS